MNNMAVNKITDLDFCYTTRHDVLFSGSIKFVYLSSAFNLQFVLEVFWGAGTRVLPTEYVKYPTHRVHLHSNNGK